MEGLKMERLVFTFLLLLAGAIAGPDDFCERGFQVATRYHDCWQQSKFANKYPDLYERHEYLDASFLERYATFMCSVVKPQALQCFKRDVKDCKNRAKLIAIADESGGACKGKELNPFFKKYVIDNLVRVPGDRESPCFTIGESAYDSCYISAGKKVMDRDLPDDIGRFHVVADMFFETYWDCLTKVYKSRAKECPNWQIPMLLILQKTALPSLFGMHLRPDQVSKLELQKLRPLTIVGKTKPTEADKKTTGCQVSDEKKVYLLMEVLTKKPSVRSGDGRLVLELSNLHSEEPEIKLEGEKTAEDKEIMEFVNVLSGPNTVTSLRERRRRRKEERKKKKQLANISSKLNGEESQEKKKKKKSPPPKKTTPKKKKITSMQKKPKNEKAQNDIYDKMVA